MPRDIPIGNGSVFVAFDRGYILREFHFPHVGKENHTLGEPFRFGIWENGKFGWLPDSWSVEMDYLNESLVTHVKLASPAWNLQITIHDCIDFHENLYLKKITVENGLDEERNIRLFLAHDFKIYGNSIGDTAEFRPEVKGLLHYKAERYFLINAYANQLYGIEHFATGNKLPGQFEGTWKDAEDGTLSGNPIAQGSVDSVIGIPLKLPKRGNQTCFYWICCGKTWEEVKTLNDIVKKKGPELFLTRTLNYWKLWVNKDPLHPDLLPPKLLHLLKRSLLIIRSQINSCGSIIAGNDSDVLHFNRDTYSYMWPRDGALVAHALDLSGYSFTSEFYNFCAHIIEKEGYFLHKYTPSGSLASSWHPWVKEKKPQLPIQEDETALVLWALWKHYEIFRDVETIKPLYKALIKRAADFMMSYRNPDTGLPLPSYDLWEERQGVLTFTVSAVHGGLMAAAHFAEAFGEVDLAGEYRRGADKMREGMDRYLYLEKEKRFARMVNFNKDGTLQVDATIDASLYGTFAFGAYSPDDEKVKTTMAQIYDTLWHKNSGGGLARYAQDSYYQSDPKDIGNPWFVTTLWLSQYYTAIAKDTKDLARALDILEWVADHALRSGVLAEQIDPKTHEPLSVSPLTWSHATFVIAAQEYLNKWLDLEKCPTCARSKLPKTLCKK